MKRLILSTLLLVVFAGQAHARIIRGDRNPQGPSDSLENCSNYLYQKLTIYSSTGDQACSQRTDRSFQECAISYAIALNPSATQIGQVQDQELIASAAACNNGVEQNLVSCTDSLTPYFGRNYRITAARYCAEGHSANFARCVGRLYAQGGMRPEDSKDACNAGLSEQMIQCVVDSFSSKGVTGARVISACKEMYDPAAIARRQADEQRRKDEERKRQEAAQKAAEEAKRKADEEKKKQQPTTPAAPAPVAPAPKPTTPSPAPAPSTPAPSDSGGGVIVDLPNF